MSHRPLRALPRLPDAEFFQDPSRTIMTANGRALLAYDQKTQSGFVYHIASAMWTVWAPVDFATYAALARLCGYVISEGEDSRNWTRACSRPETAEETAGQPLH